jgi:hypothetical protein
MRSTADRLRFKPSRSAPSLPHQVPNEHAENIGTRKRRNPKEAPALDSLENTGTRKRRNPKEAPALDSLENTICAIRPFTAASSNRMTPPHHGRSRPECADSKLIRIRDRLAAHPEALGLAAQCNLVDAHRPEGFQTQLKPTLVSWSALSDKIGTDCTRHPFDATRRICERASVHQRAPLAERDQASLFVDFAGDEMTLLVEMVVDLSLNRAKFL